VEEEEKECWFIQQTTSLSHWVFFLKNRTRKLETIKYKHRRVDSFLYWWFIVETSRKKSKDININL